MLLEFVEGVVGVVPYEHVSGKDEGEFTMRKEVGGGVALVYPVKDGLEWVQTTVVRLQDLGRRVVDFHGGW